MRRQTPIIRNGVVAVARGDGSNTGRASLRVGSSDWFAWLETITIFVVDEPSGRIIVRKERRANGWYWYAYHHHDGHARRAYLGKSTNMTALRLRDAASSLLGTDPPPYATALAPPRTRKHTSPPLIMTKFAIPPQRAVLLVLPHAIDRLQQVFDYPLTLLSAPAGFGKTTLLTQWVSVARFPVAWISLDADDNDPARFWAYLQAACARLVPGMQHHLERAQQTAPTRPAQMMLTALSGALAANAEPVVLVIDDYDVVDEDNAAIHDELAYLVEFLPPQAHLIIVSRAARGLPLARLRVHGQLNEVRADDLRFTIEEGALLLACMGIVLREEELAMLDRQIAGWVTGWQLAALSLQHCDDPARWIGTFNGSHHYITDFLTDAVLKQLSADVLTFLLQTALLDRLSAPLCDAVLTTSGSQATLEWLERKNLFVEPQDEHRQWYRYHPLFASTLRSRLYQTHAEQVPTLYRRASAWCSTNGYLNEAVAYAFKTGDFAYVADVIEMVVEVMLDHDESETIQRWLVMLPDRIMRQRPRLCVIKAHLLLISGTTASFEHYVRFAESHLDRLSAAERAPLQQEINALRMIDAILQGVSPGTEECATQTQAQLPTSQTLQVNPMPVLGNDFPVNSDVARAKSLLSVLRHQDETQGGTYFHSANITYLLTACYMRGRLSAGMHLYMRAKHAIKGIAHSGTLITLGLILYTRNDLIGAADALQQCIELRHSKMSVAAAESALALVNQAQGHVDYATRLMGRAVAATPVEIDWMTIFIINNQLRLWLMQANIETLADWIEEHKHSQLMQGPSYFSAKRLDYERLWLARLAIWQGEAARALLELARLLDEMRASGQMLRVVEIEIAQALAYDAQGNEATALAVLQRALAAATVEEYIRVFVDSGARVRELLARLQTPPYTLSSFGEKVLTAFAQPASDRQKTTALRLSKTAPSVKQLFVDALSAREMEVLHLVAEGASNQVMANTLVIALGTVKRHLSNIFMKLGVQSRTQAIIKATELDIITLSSSSS